MDSKDRLRLTLSSLGMKQQEFADSIGATQATLSRQLKGVHKIDKQAALAIQAVHNISADWLLTGKGEMFLERRRETAPIAAEPVAEYNAGPPAQSAGKNGLRAIDGSVQEYPDIDIIEKISRTRWWKELSETEREIIAFLLPLRDGDIKQKVRDVLANSYLSQKSQDNLQRGLEELLGKIEGGELKQKGEAG